MKSLQNRRHPKRRPEPLLLVLLVAALLTLGVGEVHAGAAVERGPSAFIRSIHAI
jgi:hypothetical protein